MEAVKLQNGFDAETGAEYQHSNTITSTFTRNGSSDLTEERVNGNNGEGYAGDMLGFQIKDTKLHEVYDLKKKQLHQVKHDIGALFSRGSSSKNKLVHESYSRSSDGHVGVHIVEAHPDDLKFEFETDSKFHHVKENIGSFVSRALEAKDSKLHQVKDDVEGMVTRTLETTDSVKKEIGGYVSRALETKDSVKEEIGGLVTCAIETKDLKLNQVKEDIEGYVSRTLLSKMPSDGHVIVHVDQEKHPSDDVKLGFQTLDSKLQQVYDTKKEQLHQVKEDIGALFSRGSSSKSTIVHENVNYTQVNAEVVLPTNERRVDLILEGLYQKQVPHDFWCPNCNTCITKVIIVERWTEHPREYPRGVSQPSEIEPEAKCPNCFSFLKPIGDWIKGRFQPEQQPIPDPNHIVPTGPQRPGGRKSVEIVKAIVYGGLAEIIASLGIVASASSSQAATLNIIALALANLIGGLFTIGHNLWDLKDEPKQKDNSYNSQPNEKVEDSYEHQLGKRENFWVHAIVVTLSFLVFGLVPPVVYGFSFLESDNKDLKLAAVGGASLICIILLAIAKAYVQETPKYIKTVMYYLTIGIGVSGASYLAGKLVNELLEKLGLFKSNQPATLSLSMMGQQKSALWTSY